MRHHWKPATMSRLASMWLATGLVAMLAGCSGAGVPAPEIRAATVEQMSTMQLTALQLLRGWLAMLYPPPATSNPVVDVEQVNDTTWRASGTDSWGHAFEYYSCADGSGWGYWHTSPAAEVHGVWDAPEEIGPGVLRTHIRYAYTDMTLDFQSTSDYSAGGLVPTVQEGTETLNDGRQCHFRYQTIPEVEENVTVALPDGAGDVTIRIPIRFVLNAGFRPRPRRPAAGAINAAGAQVRLSLIGTDGVWTQLATTTPGGLTGTFSLGDGMAGGGQILQGGQVVGALNWLGSLQGRLDLIATGPLDVSPLAAARDFAMDRWVSRASGLSPGGIF